MKAIRSLTRFEKGLWLVSVVGILLSNCFSGQGGWFATGVSIVGVTGLIFTSKGNFIGPAIGILYCLLYGILSWQFRYYGEVITYVGMSMPVCIVSLIAWLKNPYTEEEVRVARLTIRQTVWLWVLAVVVTLLGGILLWRLHTPNLFVSILSLATSFLACGLMVYRSPYYAVAYMANDVVIFILWIFASMESLSYLAMAFCAFLFFCNDLYGFVSWRYMASRQKGEDSAPLS